MKGGQQAFLVNHLVGYGAAVFRTLLRQGRHLRWGQPVAFKADGWNDTSDDTRSLVIGARWSCVSGQ